MCIRGMLIMTHIANLNSAAKLVFESLSDLFSVSINLFFVRTGHRGCMLQHNQIYGFVMRIRWNITFSDFLVRRCAFRSKRSESVHENTALDLADPAVASHDLMTVLSQICSSQLFSQISFLHDASRQSSLPIGC